MRKENTIKLDRILKENKAQFFLQYASSNNANFYYATNFQIGDAVLYATGLDEDLLIVPEMERHRAMRESSVSSVYSLNDLNFAENMNETANANDALAKTYLDFFKELKAKKILIPPDFPSFLSFYFRNHSGIDVQIVENPFSEIRAIKTEKEIEYIKETSNAVIDGFNYLLGLLRNERDCNKLRDNLELYFFSKGYLARNTIMASGERTSDPHFTGDGKVEKHLIADIFPKSKNTDYYSDFTRTVILERDSEIEEMLDAVIDAKERGISLIKEGVKANDVHNAVCDVLEERGYHTLRGKHREGFIHSTGHGVGLEVHEKPSLYSSDEKLKSGMVVTVEPGLYYRERGGVRVEDTVLVKKNGCEILTKFRNRVDLNE